jgi:tRNA A37 threonylcarbamoyladenosine dehydratase
MVFSRLSQLIDENQIQALTKKTVAIVGVGGVGGHAAEALARSAFSNIILVDFDKVEKSNINRQIVALHSTIGLYKVDVLEKRIKDINPACNVITLKFKYTSQNKEALFTFPIDYIIDAIDSLPDKINLIEEAMSRNIKIISVMGTGRKLHADYLSVMPLSKTSYDPIAKILRKRLKDTIDLKKLPVVSSVEKAKDNADDSLGPGSNAFVPSVAGIIAANYVFLNAIGQNNWTNF